MRCESLFANPPERVRAVDLLTPTTHVTRKKTKLSRSGALAMADAEKDSSSSNKNKRRELLSGSTEKRTSTWYQLMREDQKFATMVFVLGVALAILVGFAVVSLLSSPPRQQRRVRPAPMFRTPSLGDSTDKEYGRKSRHGPGYHDHGKEEEDSDDDDYKRKKVRVAKVGLQKRSMPATYPMPVVRTNGVSAGRPAARRAATKKTHKKEHTKKHIKTTPRKQRNKKTVKTVKPSRKGGHKAVTTPSARRIDPKKTPKRKPQRQMLEAGRVAIKKRFLPAQPIVCVVDGKATKEVSYPEDGLCDAVVFNLIFYHNGELTTGAQENRTFNEFLAAAREAKQSSFMVATDRHFATYEVVPPGPNLKYLHDMHNIRGFGYLGIRVQSAQGAMLEVYTSLLRSQVEDMNTILKGVGVTDSVVFLGLTTEEHMFDDEIVTNALKAAFTTVRVNLIIVETHQLKHSDCIESPITSWRNASGVAFDEVTATASWMVQNDMRPLLPDATIAFSSSLAAMRFWLNGQTTVMSNNRLYRCFAFSLSAYDKDICKMERRYHRASDTFFAQEQGSEGLYVYEDIEIVGKKVRKAKLAAMNLTKNVGWAFFDLEFEGDGEDSCGSPFDRISAARKALHAAA